MYLDIWILFYFRSPDAEFVGKVVWLCDSGEDPVAYKDDVFDGVGKSVCVNQCNLFDGVGKCRKSV